MEKMEDFVKNSKDLIAVFGYWPSFHDAKLLRATFNLSNKKVPSLELEIHAFEITEEIDSKGFLVLDKHVLVTMLFEQIKTQSFMEFGKQSVILGLEVGRAKGGKEVDYKLSLEIQAAWGAGISLLCNDCSIQRVEPYVVTA